MKQIDTAKLQSDMEEHGYSKQRLGGVLRCSGQTVANILNRGTASEADIEALEAIFDRPKGYYNVVGDKPSVQGDSVSQELLDALQQFSVNTFSYQMAENKELKLLNETMLTILAAIKDLQKTVAKMEGVSNNNTTKVTTAVAKVRVDTNNIASKVSEISKELKA